MLLLMPLLHKTTVGVVKIIFSGAGSKLAPSCLFFTNSTFQKWVQHPHLKSPFQKRTMVGLYLQIALADAIIRSQNDF
jgi:hypothetical protein